jgi:hypothetical protein
VLDYLIIYKAKKYTVSFLGFSALAFAASAFASFAYYGFSSSID